MKKQITIFFALFIMTTAFSQDKKVYISFGPGIGLGTARTYELYADGNNVLIENNFKTEKIVNPIGLGKGLNLNFRAGYFVNNFMAIELGVVYRLGFGTKFDMEPGSGSLKATYNSGTNKYSSNMFQLVPALVISPVTVGSKIRPYARIGIIVGVLPTILIKSDLINASGTINYLTTFKYYGSVAVGGSMAIGCDFNLSELLAIYAEIYYDALSFTPAKGKFTKYEENGKDMLPDMTKDQGKILYEKDITNYRPAVGEPRQMLKKSYPLNSAGLNFGVKIKL